MHGNSVCETCDKSFRWRRCSCRKDPTFCSFECTKYKNFKKSQKIDLIKESLDKCVIKKDGCWGWSGVIDKDGYGRMSYSSKLGSRRAHVASYLVYKGPVPNGILVCHSCDVRACTNPDHLWLGTEKQNTADMIEKGRRNNRNWPVHIGIQNVNAKLDDEKVKEIRRLLKVGVSQADLGRQFGVTKQTIAAIKLCQTWKHVEE
tara:strand:- start:136 stop:744 length:609 start_codon:yes stop_codon:yes gene_type:complete